ncbi:MAG: 2,3-bisphosphoglycerate-independent phosphoglycerate mutase [Spirochaetales bacterium]|nr:2,3-bisphosphoglycerate-independent phosphoglycerate mutase [Spirochaetales bacterium]
MDHMLQTLITENEKKIVLLVLDGVGGLPKDTDGKTELETANTPNLDKIARESETGMHLPIDFGITPGSAPGHLALFGYNPLSYPIGRGVVAAMGIGFPMKAGDVAVRLNFATQDSNGNITDRRAGRIPTETCAKLCEIISKVNIPGVEVFVQPVKDYRACVIFRGQGLSDHVADTDSQKTNVKPLDPVPTSEKGKKTAEIAKEFIKQACELLKDQHPANAVLMRGFAELPHIPSMKDQFKLNAAAIAVYPDYKGVSRIVGMDIIDGCANLSEQITALKGNWEKYTYFFIHHKYTDSKGEDGDFDAKVAEIEKVDKILPDILALKPDVLVVTGDHSTPAVMKSHSSHPIPFLIKTLNLRPDAAESFGERECAKGSWGIVKTTAIIQIALGYADKIMKFGA